MTVETPDDLRAMMNPDEFGTLIAYDTGDAVHEISVLFSRPQIDSDIASLGVTADKDQVRINAADLPEPPKEGDKLTVRGDANPFGTLRPGAAFRIVDAPKADDVRHSYLCNINPVS